MRGHVLVVDDDELILRVRTDQRFSRAARTTRLIATGSGP